MAIQLPRTLKNLNLFVDGRGHAGRVNEIKLPTLSIKTEEHRAGGMDLPVEIDLGMEKLEATLTLSDFDPVIFESFGLLNYAGIPITVRGAMQAQGSTAVQAVAVHMRGGWKSIEAGTWKPGDASTLSLTVTASYYKLVVDGEALVEIDALNMVRMVSGVDQLALQRAAICL